MSCGLEPVTSGLHTELVPLLMLRIHSQTHIEYLEYMLSHIHIDARTYIKTSIQNCDGVYCVNQTQ